MSEAPQSGSSAIDGLVRPYFMTRGRTRARSDLHLETLVRTSDGALRPVEPEQLAVLRAAREPASIVDLSARTELPVGVIRILVTDLEGKGSLTIYDNVGKANEDLVRRLISGVESL